jgi:hypothetical protein
VIQEVYDMVKEAHAHALHLTIPQHEQVYHMMMGAIRRYWRGVNF